MPPPRRTTRRAALLAMAAIPVGATLGGCDTDDLRPPSAQTTVTPSASADAPTPDESLVTEAVAAIQATVAIVAASRKVPPLRQSLGPLLRDHRRHLAALDSEQDDARVQRAAPDADAALAAVSAQEQMLQTQLVGFAVRAESGTLAALLGSMSASVGQHLAALGSAADPA